ncbi:hypothetical protein KHA96_04090 [Bacillus sp. FJAT-49711]|uniref:HEPN domain-containing protein n=1 Tax=Bacillus sp. FJAT-49711 TaxID=2833585 RepID=UPI001BC8EE1C|nr:HEPN domain-containing protein [Bacillus sp. FJAT-49711]MBS4217491.1 hypothetical protein [Bacillus sp. FJAT-49711]
MLKPDKSLHKFLLSTPARFTGRYLSEDISISISFPTDDTALKVDDNPFSRTYLVVTIRQEPVIAPGVILMPNQSFYGEVFCILLSILYGKEFKFHGMLESHGINMLPNLSNSPNSCYGQPQYNSNPRKDLEISLSLDQYGLIEPLLLEEANVDEEFRRRIIAAGKFYNRALSIFPSEPELAYLDLITCGEILSNFNEDKYTDEQLYDENLLKNFELINTLERGSSIVNDLKSRLYQVKRKYTYNLLGLLNENFFNGNETSQDIGVLTKDQSETIIKSAYDLRSLYVHEGLEFGSYISPHRNYNNEIVIGQPSEITVGKRAAKTISQSPTFLGLERMIRFALLSLLNSNKVPISKLLD